MWLSVGRQCRGLCGRISSFQCVRGCASEAASQDPVHLPSSSEVVICGGGLIGLSTALHLANAGVRDVILLEQDKIGQGPSNKGVSYVSSHHIWQDMQLYHMAQYSFRMYQKLYESDHSEIDMVPCDLLLLAQKTSTFRSLQRHHSKAKGIGVQAHMMTPKEISAQLENINTQDLLGGIRFENDARLRPAELCKAVAVEAIKSGVRIIEDIKVVHVEVDEQRGVCGVETEQGYVKTSRFVDTSGVWAGRIPLKGFPEDKPPKLPLQPCSYEYLLATTSDGSYHQTPHTVDLDGKVYLSGNKGTVTLGGFIPETITPEFLHQAPPRNFSGAKSFADWDNFYPVLEILTPRFPSLEGASVVSLLSKVDCYTPDGYMLIGALPHIRGYFVGTALNGLGPSLGGGAGALLAEWTMRDNGVHSQDVSKVDVARLLDVHANTHFLKQRACEMAGYTFHYVTDYHQSKTARNLRKSPIFYHLKEKGAVFGEIMGYERALYFLPKNVKPIVPDSDAEPRKPSWFEYVEAEYIACRERVAVIDMTHFSKFDVVGENADEVVKFLQKVCSADVDKPIGTTVYTGMQNEAGGYVTDCTLSRLGSNHYFMIAPTVQQVRCKMWLERHIPANSGVVVQDLTSTYTALNVLGPSSRHLLQDLTGIPMTPSHFPAFSCKELDVGFASGVRAVSVSHCGELGWVLYIPNEFAEHVYEDVVEAGKNYGLQHAGYLTLRHLRIEKFYVYWGMDIDATTTPHECGRAFRVELKKPDFIGKKAIEEEAAKGSKRRYVQLLLSNHNLHKDPWPQGQEPIFRNGQFCGMTTTASYGFTLECQVCLGWIKDLREEGDGIVTQSYILDPSARYEVEIEGRRFRARLNLISPQLSMVSSEHPSHYRPTQT